MAKKLCRNFCIFRFSCTQCLGKTSNIFPGALSTEKPKSAEISTQVFSHAASFRCCRVLCSGLWRHSKVFDSSGPNLHPKNYLHPYGTNGSGDAKNLHFFGPKFLHGMPLGANTFRWGECPKKCRKGPKCVSKQVWTSYDTQILRFCILSEKKRAFYPPPVNKRGLSFK